MAGCSPVYVLRSAAGHGKLLCRRQKIEKAAADPKLDEAVRRKLALALEIRAFAFETMGLERSRDYASYSRVDGRFLTYLVSGSEKTRLKAYQWSFPFVGTFPYKGFFRKEHAESEKRLLEEKGYDAALRGVAAYNTPLWFADPLPSTALESSPGVLAELLLHELTHGTVFFKSRVAFNESLASFAGEKGAEQFLARRFGPESPELEGYLRERDNSKTYDGLMEKLTKELETLYSGPTSETEKLEARRSIFARAKDEFEKKGFALREINNALVVAHRVYRADFSLFERAFEANGRDWPKTFAFFKALDRKDPEGALRRAYPD